MSELESRLGARPFSGDDPGWLSLRSRLIGQAGREDLLELAFERHDSPFGTIMVIAGEAGILRVALAAEAEEAVLTDLAGRVSGRIARAPRSSIKSARKQFDGYFAGSLKSFDLPLDWSLVTGFRRDVLRQTALIPYGSTASYAEMAARSGSPRAVRAAGSALARNPLPIIVPCHRVLRSDGTVGEYLGGSSMKSGLLAMEAGLTGAAGPGPT